MTKRFVVGRDRREAMELRRMLPAFPEGPATIALRAEDFRGYRRPVVYVSSTWWTNPDYLNLQGELAAIDAEIVRWEDGRGE